MDLLAEALRFPERPSSWSPHRWESLIGQARRAKLLARLAILFDDRGLLERIPRKPLRHMLAARRLAVRQHGEVLWEADRLRHALSEVGLPVVLLKGAAYVAAGLPCARGRLLSDIDILVPRDRTSEVEAVLFRYGWISTALDAYDQRYYRTWMHELPPMRHITRQTVLDVHHSIVPLTSRYRLDAAKLISDARPIAGGASLWSLAPVDMVLHSAAHLILEGEFENGLRDLVDIDNLLEEFGADPTFWKALPARARELDLRVPLSFAVELAIKILGTAVPAPFREEIGRGAPPFLARAPLARLFETAVRPNHPSSSGTCTELARWLLYIRGHYLRMPMRLLIPHLVRKGWRRRSPGQ